MAKPNSTNSVVLALLEAKDDAMRQHLFATLKAIDTALDVAGYELARMKEQQKGSPVES